MSTRTDVPTTSRWRFVAVVIAIAAAALTGAYLNEGATAEASTATPTPNSPRVLLASNAAGEPINAPIGAAHRAVGLPCPPCLPVGR